jgi:DGQHR domain-containing protein
MEPNISNLKSSWTKFDAVKVIQITKENDLLSYVKKEKGIDEPTLRNFLGVDTLTNPLPEFWTTIQNYPDQVGLFALMASIFTHHENVNWFANYYSKGNMEGLFSMSEGKHFTNLRSALVESGATDKFFRRKQEVPYDLSKLFKSGEVGLLMKQLLENRLAAIGYSQEDIDNRFFEICEELMFPKVLSLTNEQFKSWIEGIGISNSLYELEKNGITYKKYGKIKAFKVKQWLKEWDDVSKYNSKNRKKPESFFYQFNIPALLLKRIYEIHNRHSFVGKKDEPFSQRKHSEERSNEIREYIKGGYPWSTISIAQKESETYKDLQMPGWLPTSLIANILAPNSLRRLKTIEDDSIIKINKIDDDLVELILPEKIWTDMWMPLVSPIEIIDGQHRIKAFDNISEINGNYDFPVIAFHDLDFTWQAYLFYTINIKPKRINTSLAYDLMPLLRIQDWLEHDLNGPDVYKKIRAQELTETLWRSPISPWHNRINMLGDVGESSGGPVSQNAFINSLTNSFVKKWDGKLGGLFGGEMTQGEQDVIQWDKETQAAYLIFIWKAINSAIIKSKAEWIIDLKSKEIDDAKIANGSLHIGFYHPKSFFTTDQGIRPILLIFNDMSFIANGILGLNKFYVDIDYEKYSVEEIIGIIVSQFKDNQIINEFVNGIAAEIVNKFDWRTPSAFDPNNREQDLQRQFQNQFRGSGGYREMRIQLLRILAVSDLKINNDAVEISGFAKEIQTKLGL